jgi:hypothetical protein
MTGEERLTLIRIGLKTKLGNMSHYAHKRPCRRWFARRR